MPAANIVSVMQWTLLIRCHRWWDSMFMWQLQWVSARSRACMRTWGWTQLGFSLLGHSSQLIQCHQAVKKTPSLLRKPIALQEASSTLLRQVQPISRLLQNSLACLLLLRLQLMPLSSSSSSTARGRIAMRRASCPVSRQQTCRPPAHSGAPH